MYSAILEHITWQPILHVTELLFFITYVKSWWILIVRAQSQKLPVPFSWEVNYYIGYIIWLMSLSLGHYIWLCWWDWIQVSGFILPFCFLDLLFIEMYIFGSHTKYAFSSVLLPCFCLLHFPKQAMQYLKFRYTYSIHKLPQQLRLSFFLFIQNIYVIGELQVKCVRSNTSTSFLKERVCIRSYLELTPIYTRLDLEFKIFNNIYFTIHIH